MLKEHSIYIPRATLVHNFEGTLPQGSSTSCFLNSGRQQNTYHGQYIFAVPTAFFQVHFRQAYVRVNVRQTFLSRGSGSRPSLHLFPGYIKDSTAMASTDKRGSSAVMNSKWFSCIRVWGLVNFSLTYISMFISILTSTLIMSSLICPEPHFS